MELLVSLLPDRVGSLLSVKSLSEDLSVSFATVDRWLTILENLYYCYRIAPYSSPGSSKVRAIKKEKKLFLWDWSEVGGANTESKGERFENMVASHLLKYCHFFEDYYGEKMELRFLRDRDGREVDFVVLKNSQPLFGVECKTGEKQISRHIQYFRERTDIPAFYQVHLGEKDYGNEAECRVIPFEKFVDRVLSL